MAILIRCTRNDLDLRSPEVAWRRLPSSLTRRCAASPNGPRVSRFQGIRSDIGAVNSAKSRRLENLSLDGEDSPRAETVAAGDGDGMMEIDEPVGDSAEAGVEEIGNAEGGIDEDEWTFSGDNPLLNPVVLSHVLYYITNKAQLRELRLVCSTWNAEIMRRFQTRRIIVRAGKRVHKHIHGIFLADSIEVFKNKSIDPLFTKFIFEVDVTDPMFMEFLRLAGPHTDEVMAGFTNTDESIAVLREILETLPNLVTLGVNLKDPAGGYAYDENWGACCSVKQSQLPLMPHLRSREAWSTDQPDVPRSQLNEERHLFPDGVPIVYPNIKHINFHAATDCKFKTLARDLILATPNLEEFECTNFGGTGAAGQVVRIEKWFFETAVLDEDFPTLIKLKAFNRDLRVQYTDVELIALTNRRFPLTRLVLNCFYDATISVEVLENLFIHLGPTLKKLDLTLTSEDPLKAKDLSKSVRHLSKLEQLVAENFHVSLGTIYSNLPKLTLLKVRYFDAVVMGSFVPKPLSIHPLQELHLRDSTSGNISIPFIQSVNLLFPRIRELTLSAELIEFGSESLVYFTTSTLRNLRFLFFVRKSNTLYLQMRKDLTNGFVPRRFNEYGVPAS